MKRPTTIVIACVTTALVGVGAYLAGVEKAPAPVIAADGGDGPPPGQGSVQVTYIANEGVLLAAGDRRVLIDGLFREYRAAYPFLPEPHRERIETAQPPFDGIDVVLVSHVHLDHFHPESVGRHLASNPSSVLVSSEQVVGEVSSKFGGFESVKARARVVTPALGERIPMTVGGVEFEVLGVGHGTGRHGSVQNLGHIVKLGGLTFLHIGDADPGQGTIERLKLVQDRIDVAFLPGWFMTEAAGIEVVRTHIRPRHIVAVHMPASGADAAVARITAAFPDAAAFTTLLERRSY